MAQTQNLKRRIRSVKNAGQITKALEVVAASRMRKVVGLVEGSRKYGELASEIMQRIAPNPEVKDLPYFTQISLDKPALYIIFTSDRGQAGAYNTNIFNLAISMVKLEKQRPKIIVYGRKGERFFARLAGIELMAAFEDIADIPEANVFSPALEIINDGLSSGEIGKVRIIHTEFISSLTQKASSYQLIPVQIQETELPEGSNKVFEFEPETQEVLDESLRLYFEAKLMQSRIEAAAAEHAMRMIAMGNANRNAKDLVEGLTLELNATRQAAITQEIAEITGGAAAIAA